MNKIFRFVVVFALLMSMNVFAKKPQEVRSIILPYCSHFGKGVSPSFVNCVNSNFKQIKMAVGGYYSHCINFGKEVDYGFTSCVNSNFVTVEKEMQNTVLLQSCYNFNRATLDFSFISCVNSNFSKISLELSK